MAKYRNNKDLFEVSSGFHKKPNYVVEKITKQTQIYFGLEDDEVEAPCPYTQNNIDFVDRNKFNISRYKIPRVPIMNRTHKKFALEEECRKTIV